MGPHYDRHGRRAEGDLEPAPLWRVREPFIAALQRSDHAAQPPRTQAVLVLTRPNHGSYGIRLGRPGSPGPPCSIAAAVARTAGPEIEGEETEVKLMKKVGLCFVLFVSCSLFGQDIMVRSIRIGR